VHHTAKRLDASTKHGSEPFNTVQVSVEALAATRAESRSDGKNSADSIAASTYLLLMFDDYLDLNQT
jgi:hypothetical protein